MGKKGGVVVLVQVLVVTITIWCASTALGFKCGSEAATCAALIDYTSPNETNYQAIQTLFNISNFIDLVGANALPSTTRPTDIVRENQVVRIPFTCKCRNSTGLSDGLPRYTVKSGDTLSHIAEQIFSRLVTWQQIQAANNISDGNKIDVGQEFWIPLPCSCDQVNNTKVVHYGLVVASGSSVQELAQRYGTTQDILLSLNNMTDPNKLLAGQIFDVPLKACSLAVKNESLNFNLLVASSTDLYTANDCVKCSCDSANNWTAQCVASELVPTKWSSCPSMQCQISNSTRLNLGNVTSSCPRTTCAYAGYTNNGTIFTNLVTDSTCPASGASRTTFQGSASNLVLIAIHFVLLSLYLCF